MSLKYPELENRRIIIGVTGSIASYKILELVRGIVRAKGQVKVVMTRNATKFITPYAFSTLTGNPVYVDLFPPDFSWSPLHISLSEWGEVMLVAPATANILGKAANGIADDLLSTLILSFPNPIIFAPAMNENMWKNPAVEENICILRERGFEVIPPEKGELATGKVGEGRLPSPETLLFWLRKCFYPQNLKGLKILITAGPTREYIDDIRFISNPSSGKMGYFLAEEAVLRGAEVILISGESTQPVPPGVEKIVIEKGEELEKEVKKFFPSCDVLIMNAAVTDFRPCKKMEGKIKREGKLSLELIPVPDILAGLGKEKKGKLIVGFSLETEEVEKRALEKFKKKKVDIMVGCLQKEGYSGFKVENMEGIIIYSTRQKERFSLTKRELAELIMERIAERRFEK